MPNQYAPSYWDSPARTAALTDTGLKPVVVVICEKCRDAKRGGDLGMVRRSGDGPYLWSADVYWPQKDGVDIDRSTGKRLSRVSQEYVFLNDAPDVIYVGCREHGKAKIARSHLESEIAAAEQSGKRRYLTVRVGS